MTLVHFDLRRGNFTDPIEGSVWITPIKRIHVEDGPDDYIVLTDAVEYALTDGQADIDMIPSDVDWAWVVTEAVPTGIVRYVAVPDQAEAEYGDLQDIDPATLDPAAEPIAAWWTAAANAVAAAQTATDAADSAALSLSLTEQYADNASIFAEQAAQSATTANSSRINAGLARTGAETAQIAAETARTGAETAQSGAQTARSGAETARTGAEAARDLSLAGQFAGSVIATGTNLDTIITAGIYRQITGTGATTALGFPVDGIAGILEVYRPDSVSADYMIHRFTGSTSAGQNGVWLRRRSAGVWQAWRMMPTTRVVNPSDQPGIQLFQWDPTANTERQLVVTGTALGTVDLNLVTISGDYVQSNAQGADYATRNYPILGGLGVLEVTNTTNTVLQRFTQTGASDTAARGEFVRRMIVSTGIWSPWRFIASQRVDNTAGKAIYTYDDTQIREQLVFGDTGWRQLTPVNGWTSANGIFIRRLGTTVHMLAGGLIGTAATSDAFTDPVPVGFRGTGMAVSPRFPIFVGNAPDTARSAAVDISTGTGRVLNAYAGLNGGTAMITYPTNDPWPTTLPGSASGTIPNL